MATKGDTAITRHDQFRNVLARDYDTRPYSCDYCESVVQFPPGRLEIEKHCENSTGIQYRPDISVWHKGCLISTLEVIDSHPPRDEVLEAQAELPNAFYFNVNGAFWCSPECYKWNAEGLERISELPRCLYCDRMSNAVAYRDMTLVDWENPSGEICLECAVQHLDGAQYKDPGECMAGITVPAGQDDTIGLILALNDAVFWAMVWTSRDAKGVGAARTSRDESATSRQLDEVDQAFDSGEWERGANLLAPIGVPVWSADRTDPPLFAWEPKNCHRTAALWTRLREWRVTQLPADLRRLVKLPELSAMPDRPVVAPIVHEGFPDGTFTRCGIDRRTLEVDVVATMQRDNITCRDCC